jgi:septum formation topological specificity factor MinE
MDDEKAWAKDILKRVGAARSAIQFGPVYEDYLAKAKKAIRQCIDTYVHTDADIVTVHLYQNMPISACSVFEVLHSRDPSVDRSVVSAIPNEAMGIAADQIVAWASSLGFNAERANFLDYVRIVVKMVPPQ